MIVKGESHVTRWWAVGRCEGPVQSRVTGSNPSYTESVNTRLTSLKGKVQGLLELRGHFVYNPEARSSGIGIGHNARCLWTNRTGIFTSQAQPRTRHASCNIICTDSRLRCSERNLVHLRILASCRVLMMSSSLLPEAHGPRIAPLVVPYGAVTAPISLAKWNCNQTAPQDLSIPRRCRLDFWYRSQARESCSSLRQSRRSNVNASSMDVPLADMLKESWMKSLPVELLQGPRAGMLLAQSHSPLKR